MCNKDIVWSHITMDYTTNPAFFMKISQPSGSPCCNLLSGSPLQSFFITAEYNATNGLERLNSKKYCSLLAKYGNESQGKSIVAHK